MYLNRTLAGLMIAAAAIVSAQCGQSDVASPSSSASLSLPTAPSSLELPAATDSVGGDIKSLTRAVGDLTNSTPELGRLKVCKEGNSGTFLVTVKTNSNGNPSPNPSGSTSVAINTCRVVAEDFTNVTGQGTTFTMGESSAGCLSAVRNDLGSGTTPITCANTDYFLNNFHGITVTFTNSPPAPPPAQLAVVKTPDGGTFSQGAQVSFTIVVSNPAAAGSASATNVTLTDALPGNGGLVWATASTTQGSCVSPIVGNALSCSLGTIAPGGSVTVTVTSTATTPAAACQAQNNPAAIATSGSLTAQNAGSLTCTPPQPVVALFVIGDVEPHGIGDNVNFWGAQWWKNNEMSGFVANGVASFKGFATESGTCGQTWISRPGNSSDPPQTIPDLVAVIVTDTVTKNGPNIGGTIKQIVLVRHDGGYGPAPGKRGNGPVESIVCTAQ